MRFGYLTVIGPAPSYKRPGDLARLKPPKLGFGDASPRAAAEARAEDDR
jgi:hypothetical protein